jgi:hypothetical protein
MSALKLYITHVFYKKKFATNNFYIEEISENSDLFFNEKGKSRIFDLA